MSGYRCSIVVPVRDESRSLIETVPPLWKAAAWHAARIIWVCNGCSDDSAEVIRNLTTGAGEIVELRDGGKAAALQAGDAVLGDLFPRVYVDADVRMTTDALGHLLAELEKPGLDLVAASVTYDLSAASRISAAITRCWAALPYARMAAFQQALGISARGRSLWDQWPDIIGDDIFMAVMIAPSRRRIVADAVVATRPPANFSGWVCMRARWRRGERQLGAMGLAPPATPGQRSALVLRLLNPRTAPGAWLFLGARILSSRRRADSPGSGWRPDRPTTER